MENFKVKAKFKGADGSLGYINGNYYLLEITHTKSQNISITRENYEGYCEYVSMTTFLKNWDQITKIK